MSAFDLVSAAIDREDCLRTVDHMGARWLHDELLPALAEVRSAALPWHAELCAEACYVVGDVHETHGAPEAAISWYRRTLEHDPDEAAAWRELGTCQLDMGQHDLARVSLERARELDPDDRFTQRELRDLAVPTDPVYVRGDVAWAAAEALAADRPDLALAALADDASDRAARHRLTALAADDDRAAFLAELERLGGMTERVSLDHAMWFYLSDGLLHDARLWSVLASWGDRIEWTGWVTSDHPRLPRPTSRPDVEPSALVRLQLRALR